MILMRIDIFMDCTPCLCTGPSPRYGLVRYSRVYCNGFQCMYRTDLQVYCPVPILEWRTNLHRTNLRVYSTVLPKSPVHSGETHTDLHVYWPESPAWQLARTRLKRFPLLLILTLSASLSSRGLLSLF